MDIAVAIHDTPENVHRQRIRTRAEDSRLKLGVDTEPFPHFLPMAGSLTTRRTRLTVNPLYMRAGRQAFAYGCHKVID